MEHNSITPAASHYSFKARIFPADLKASGHGVEIEVTGVPGHSFEAARRSVIEHLREKFGVNDVMIRGEHEKDYTTFGKWED